MTEPIRAHPATASPPRPADRVQSAVDSRQTPTATGTAIPRSRADRAEAPARVPGPHPRANRQTDERRCPGHRFPTVREGTSRGREYRTIEETGSSGVLPAAV